MHFHWEDFDAFAARILRVFGPPLVNFAILVLFFSELIGIFLNYLLVQVRAVLANAFGWDETPSQTVSGFSSALQNLIEKIDADVLNAAISKLDGRMVSAFFSGATSAFSGLASASYGAILWTIFLILALAFILDGLLRLLALVIPLRLRINEKQLTYHVDFQNLFKAAAELILIVSRRRSDKTDENPIKQRQRNACPLQHWLRIRALIEKNGGLERHQAEAFSLYRSIESNQRWFSYVVAYGALLVLYAVYSIRNANGGEGASGGVGQPYYVMIGILVFLLISGFLLCARHIQLSKNIIENDLEAFVSLGQMSEVYVRLGGREDDSHGQWWRAISLIGYSKNDRSGSILLPERFRNKKGAA